LNGATQGPAQTNQKRAFGGCGLNLLRASGSENGVLGFQVGDLAQKDGLRHVDEKNQKRVLASGGHGKIGLKRWPIRRFSDMKIFAPKKPDLQRRRGSGTSFLHTAERRGGWGACVPIISHEQT
jgi:hypothetical protein